MPSPTDFNVSPYYDDFSDSKNFHRILFRPAFAVQARELTQSQTQIQNQIERLSDHIFDKGAMIIPGEIGYDLKYYAVKLTSKSVSDISMSKHVKSRNSPIKNDCTISVCRMKNFFKSVSPCNFCCGYVFFNCG